MNRFFVSDETSREKGVRDTQSAGDPFGGIGALERVRGGEDPRRGEFRQGVVGHPSSHANEGRSESRPPGADHGEGLFPRVPLLVPPEPASEHPVLVRGRVQGREVFRVRPGVRPLRGSCGEREGGGLERGSLQKDREPALLRPRLHPLEAARPSGHQVGERARVRPRHVQDQAVRLRVHEAGGDPGQQDQMHLAAVPTARDLRDSEEREIRVQEERRLLAIRDRAVRLPDRESAVADGRPHTGSRVLGLPKMVEEEDDQSAALVQAVHAQAAAILQEDVRAQAREEAARDRDQQVLEGLVVREQDQPQRHVHVGGRERGRSEEGGQFAVPRHDPRRSAERGREQEQAEEASEQLRARDDHRSEGRHEEDLGVGDAVRLEHRRAGVRW